MKSKKNAYRPISHICLNDSFKYTLINFLREKRTANSVKFNKLQQNINIKYTKFRDNC